jgi:hypothetical protein
MTNYVINKENSIAKVRSEAKAALMADLLEFLTEKYGDSAGWVRVGGASKSNVLAVQVAEAEVEGEILPIYAKFDASICEFITRDTEKKHYDAFNLEDAKAEYETYLIEKADKAAAASAKKAKAVSKNVDF